MAAVPLFRDTNMAAVMSSETIYTREIREYFNSHFVVNQIIIIFPLPKGSGNYLILDRTCMKLFSNFTHYDLITNTDKFIKEAP